MNPVQMNEHPLMKALYIATAGSIVKTRTNCIQRLHGSEHYVVMYCYDGKGWFQRDNQEKTAIVKHTAILIQPGNPYSYGTDEDDPWSFYYVHVRGDNCPLYFQSLPAIHIVELKESHLKCKQLFAECYQHWSIGASIQNAIYSSHLLGLLLTMLTLFQNHPQSGLTKDDHVNDLIQYMLRHIDERITLQQLCKRTNLSIPYLVKLFNKHTGHSPIDYFLRLKIKRACEYFDSTDLTVKEVCYKLGFTDPYYFSRLFSKIMGQPPKKYRFSKNEESTS